MRGICLRPTREEVQALCGRKPLTIPYAHTAGSPRGERIMKTYEITLSVESELELEQLTKDSWGAFLIGANHPWQIIKAERVNL